jgi:hypothetical protein
LAGSEDALQPALDVRHEIGAVQVMEYEYIRRAEDVNN